MDPLRFHCKVENIVHRALDPNDALDFVGDASHGGIALFVGKVRKQNQGREVIGIDYDLFEPLTLKQFERAAVDSIGRYGPALKVYVAHAHGQLKIGDIAVVVAAGSPHRDEAFGACRELVEAVKYQAPIWKREHNSDGSTAWSEGCSLRYDGTSSSAPSQTHSQSLKA